MVVQHAAVLGWAGVNVQILRMPVDLWQLLQETARHSMRGGRCDSLEIFFSVCFAAMRDSAVSLLVLCSFNVFYVCFLLLRRSVSFSLLSAVLL